MAWIESHQTLGQHPKTRRLARYLGISLPAAVGHLHYLWWWALNYAQNGDLSRYELEDIADAALWDGDAKSFVEALVKSGFLDLADEGLCIHDWDDYAGRLIDKRKANSERARKWREKKNNEHEMNAFVMHNERATNDATVPNLTVPNQDDYKIDSGYKALQCNLEPERETSLSSSVNCKDENQKVDISNPVGIDGTKISEDGKESSAGDFHESEDQEVDSYTEAVEERMRQRTGNPSYVVKRWDFKAVQDLMRRGIPLDFVLHGIDKAFEGFRPAHAEDRIETFSYCRKVILGLWGEEQERKKLKADGTPALAGERTARNRRSRADPEPVGRYIPDGPPEDPELDEFLKKAGFYDIPGIT